MSLTRHQNNNTAVWSIIDAAINQEKVESAVTQINAVCYSRQIIKLREYPQMFNFALTGKAVIYAYILTYHKDLFYKTLVGRRMHDTSCIFKWPDVVAQAVCAAIAEDCIRRSNTFTSQAIAGKASIAAGVFEGPNKALYDDVSALASQLSSMDRPVYDPDFNVSPALAGSIGGADVQLTFGPEVWSLHTTLKSRPVSVDKLKQQIAYFLLDCDKHLHSFNGWKELVFYFPRHQQFIKLNPLDYINLDGVKTLHKGLDSFDFSLGYLESDEYNRDMFFQD